MSDLCVLVFPLDIDTAAGFIDQAKALGIKVVGASSVMKNAGRLPVDDFFRLPFITDDSFASEFLILKDKVGFTHVFAPHGGVWSYLSKCKAYQPDSYSFMLCEPSPYLADWLKFKPSYDWASAIADVNFIECLDLSNHEEIRDKLSMVRLAGLHKQFVNISGQCDDDKLAALTEIARVLPKGDLVEIGSLMGKSAFVLGWLAQYYELGSFVSVDPWDKDKTVDQGDDAKILNDEWGDEESRSDFHKVFDSYLGSMSLLTNVGYIKDVSEHAVKAYCDASKKGVLDSPGLGSLPIEGEIALLHVDGNHRYDFVAKDVECWEPYIKPGGWLLLDDYVWVFGDGPRKVGDELLQTDAFDISFTMSDTLFLRKKFVSACDG